MTILAVLFPILIIEWPTLRKGIDMGISGTYDVLLFSFLLPQDQVLKLLPTSLRAQENLWPVPVSIIDALNSDGQYTETEKMHPVLLQMGYQISTGPGPTWIPKFSFNECKMEVPFLRHPSGKSSLTYAFKQHM